MSHVINIQPVKQSESIKKDVLEIMAAHADQKTIRLALKAYKSAVGGGISISDCTFFASKEESAIGVDEEEIKDFLNTLPDSDV